MVGRKHSRLLPPGIKTKTSANASFDWLIFRILLNCYGFDKMEEISRYWTAQHHQLSSNNDWVSHFRFCIYESGDFRERKLNKNEKPLSVQSQWSSNSHYHRFILRRATRSVSNQVWRAEITGKVLLRDVSLFQFPEETCVDDNDRELLARCLFLTYLLTNFYPS